MDWRVWQSGVWLLLLPANEVWGKVIFLHLFVILFTGGRGLFQHALQVVSQHALQQGVCYPSMHWRWYPSIPCSRGGAILACIAGGIPACLAAGGVCSRGLLRGGGSAPRGVPGGDPPGRLLLRAVRILLECILVSTCHSFQARFREQVV